MILIISSKYSGSTDEIMSIFAKRGIPAFRLNLDMFSKYRFLWQNDSFEIEDAIGRVCKS